MQKAWYECHWLAVYFQALHNDLNLPISVLRVIYDMNDKNPDAVVKAILEKYVLCFKIKLLNWC